MKRFNPESIRIIREARNMSRADLAAAMGGSASRQLIHMWETGKCNPSADYLSNIVNVLGLKSLDIFFTSTDQQSDSQRTER